MIKPEHKEGFGVSRAFGSTNRANKLPIITKFHRKLRPFESLKWTRVHCLHARPHGGPRPATFLREPKSDRAGAPASASFDL